MPPFKSCFGCEQIQWLQEKESKTIIARNMNAGGQNYDGQPSPVFAESIFNKRQRLSNTRSPLTLPDPVGDDNDTDACVIYLARREAYIRIHTCIHKMHACLYVCMRIHVCMHVRGMCLCICVSMPPYVSNK